MTKDREADPRVLRLVQQWDDERRARIKAERQASALRATLARVMAQHRKAAETERETAVAGRGL
jgi:hypothetical protein